MAEYIEKWSVVNRLIDIENEFQQYKPFHGFEHAMYRKICEAEIAIGKAQAADVAPVGHGRWILEETKGGFHMWVCNRCGRGVNRDPEGIDLYCYHCGAKMDGSSNEE